jgi:transcriptional regulator with XRE-family HTH domain
VTGERPEWAKRLLNMRVERGWSMRDLAQRLYRAAETDGQKQIPDVDSIVRSIRRWEAGAHRPDERSQALLAFLFHIPASAANNVLSQVPHAFPAGALDGWWVSSYQYRPEPEPLFHVDVARVVAQADRHILATNHPPEPRTDGRAAAFRNEVSAELAGRHLIGAWRNLSDTRYFGSLHLAVLPGETVMDGLYTGLATDIEISFARWRWVRLNPATIDGVDLSAVTLHSPTDIHSTIERHSPRSGPLDLTAIGDVA